MAASGVSNGGNGDLDDLLVFGYACKVYRDDERALQAEKALIPWMGDEQNTVDRYDGRGHLSSLAEFEASAGAWDKYWASLGPEEVAEEQMVEEERWLSLNDEEEEARDEILKRAAAPAENFAEIGFTYDNEDGLSNGDTIGVQNKPNDFVDPDDKPYKLPKGLTLPVTVPRPDTRREHTIIEKTAEFIARQGGQLEVLIRMKQKNNSQFAFLDIEHKLNLYYRFLVQQIRSGAYRPSLARNESDSESGSDSDDGYLHPSLFASKNTSTMSSGPPEALKNIFKAQASKSKGTCAYSQLIDKIRPSLEIDQEVSNGPSCDNTCSADSMSNADSNGTRDEFAFGPPGNSEHNMGAGPLTVELESLVAIMPPPPDVQPIVDKMAEYVAKNGHDFEESIRAKGDPKFKFVDPGDEFHEYYQFKLQEFRSSLSKTNATAVAAPQVIAEAQSKPVASLPDSGPVKGRKSPNALERIALENSLNTSPERTPRERRVEKRKMKISLKSTLDNSDQKGRVEKAQPTTETESSSIIGPLLPSLYDDEDVEVREDILEELAKDKKASSTLAEPARKVEGTSREKKIMETKHVNKTRTRSRSAERKHSDRDKGRERGHHRRERSHSRERSRRSRSRGRQRDRDKEHRERRHRHEDPPAPPPTTESDSAVKDCGTSASRSECVVVDDELKRKQLERKKKLAAFLTMVKCQDGIQNEKKGEVYQTDLKAKLRHLKKTMADSDEESALGEADSRRPLEDRDLKVPLVRFTKDAPKEEAPVKNTNVDLKKLRKVTREDGESFDNRDSDEDLYERRRRKSRERKRRRSSSSSSPSSSPTQEGSSRSRRRHHKHHKSKSSRRHRD